MHAAGCDGVTAKRRARNVRIGCEARSGHEKTYGPDRTDL